MATSSLSSLFILLLALALVSARYRYYYPKSSYRDMCAKVKQLEDMVNSLKQPIHVHVNGNNDEASLSADGTHIHVHVATDNQQQALTARTPADDEYSYASCYVQPNPVGSSSVQGFVHLRQRPASQIEIKTELSGFPRAGQYGFHVHEVSDYQNGCNSFGGHYNPYGKVHGGPLDTVRHVGDWGNLQVDDAGRNDITTTDRMASLFGTDSIVGRGMVIHAGVDDLGRGGNEGSLKTGNAGARLACCVIGLTKGGPW